MAARESKPVLILPNADVDIATWFQAGEALTSVEEYWRRWKEPLLPCSEPVTVLLSLPSESWNHSRPEYRAWVREEWATEIDTLRALFCSMRDKLSLQVCGPEDLTPESADAAVNRAIELLTTRKTTLAAAHVPTEPSPLGYYFEVGQGGQLNEETIARVGRSVLEKGERDHRAIFVACETRKTGLPKAFVTAGLTTVFLATVEQWDMFEASTLLKAVLVAGFGEPGAETLDSIWATYLKLRGFPHTEGSPSKQALPEVSSVLILEGSPVFPNGNRPYYIVHPTQNGALLLEPLWRNEVLERVSSLNTGSETLLLVDAPRGLRKDLAHYLERRPLLWVASGATCASVAVALLEEDVDYHIGGLCTASQSLIYALLMDRYGCLSVTGVSPDNLAAELAPLLESSAVRAADLRDWLTRMARCKANQFVVVGARP